jgi:hypothetical protein
MSCLDAAQRQRRPKGISSLILAAHQVEAPQLCEARVDVCQQLVVHDVRRRQLQVAQTGQNATDTCSSSSSNNVSQVATSNLVTASRTRPLDHYPHPWVQLLLLLRL